MIGIEWNNIIIIDRTAIEAIPGFKIAVLRTVWSWTKTNKKCHKVRWNSISSDVQDTKRVGSLIRLPIVDIFFDNMLRRCFHSHRRDSSIGDSSSCRSSEIERSSESVVKNSTCFSMIIPKDWCTPWRKTSNRINMSKAERSKLSACPPPVSFSYSS